LVAPKAQQLLNFFRPQESAEAATMPTIARPSDLLGWYRVGGRADGQAAGKGCGMKRYLQRLFRHELTRAVTDFGLAMGLIWLISLGTTAHHGKTFLLLSLTVASMVALDLAFLRHLRRVYASPRRGVWRRD